MCCSNKPPIQPIAVDFTIHMHPFPSPTNIGRDSVPFQKLHPPNWSDRHITKLRLVLYFLWLVVPRRDLFFIFCCFFAALLFLDTAALAASYVPHQAMENSVSEWIFPDSLCQVDETAVVAAEGIPPFRNRRFIHISYQNDLSVLCLVSRPKCVFIRTVFHSYVTLLEWCPS